MAKTFKALFNGTGDLTAYTPEIGSWTAPIDADFDDGGVHDPNLSLEVLVRDGVGGVLENYLIDTDPPRILLLLDGVPAGDVFMEVQISTDLDTALVPNHDMYLGLRAQPNWPGSNDLWDFIGGQFRLGDVFTPDTTITASVFTSYGGSTGGTGAIPTGSYPTGRTTFILRVEIVDNWITLYVDGSSMYTEEITEPHFLTDGQMVFMFVPNSWDYDATYYLSPLLSITAGTLPDSDAGAFWTANVKATEYDS